MNNYENLSVEELIKASREHDDSAFAELVRRYNPLMVKLVSSFDDSESSPEDLLAEATVALHTALLKYNLEQSKVTFGLYARICINNRLIDVLRREEARPEVVEYDIEEYSSGDEPIEGIVSRERVSEMLSSAQRVLSDYEYKVLLLYIQGYKSAAIAKELSKTSKSVDNAKARIFRRLREMYGKGEN